MSDKPKAKKKLGWFEIVVGIPALVLLLAWCNMQEKTEVAAGPSKPEAITVRTLVNPGSSGVLVWRDSAAMDLALRLMRDGEAKGDPSLHRDAIAPLLACRPANGSGLIKTDGGMFSSTIMVLDGAAKGCKGVVDNAWIRTTTAEPGK